MEVTIPALMSAVISCGVVGRFGIRNQEGKGEEEESETDSQSHYCLASIVIFNSKATVIFSKLPPVFLVKPLGYTSIGYLAGSTLTGSSG